MRLVKRSWHTFSATVAFAAMVFIMGWIWTEAHGIEMPGTIVLDSIQKTYGPVTFDHAMHAGFAGSCAKCHHQHNEKSIAVCKECHDLDTAVFRSSALQGFLPCNGCHLDYSPETPGVPGLKVALHKKCFQCHIGINELGVSPRGCTETCHTKTAEPGIKHR